MMTSLISPDSCALPHLTLSREIFCVCLRWVCSSSLETALKKESGINIDIEIKCGICKTFAYREQCNRRKNPIDPFCGAVRLIDRQEYFCVW